MAAGVSWAVDRQNTSFGGFAPILSPLTCLVVQRLFSTFPSGSPGVGLLLLRAALAVALLVHGAKCLGDHHSTLGASAVGVMVALSGGLLLLGLMTPLAGLLAAVGTGALSVSWLPSPHPNVFDVGLTALLVVLVAVATALLGPGAFSLDAVLFGRREITIPQKRAVPAGD
jgi:uncharacterized membrane protein YphA (DoxX/SURF4 family)